jgi:hypothetical protein
MSLDRCKAYRHFAAQCLELARHIDGPQDRAVLLEMALLWSRLAELAAQPTERSTEPTADQASID